MTDVERAAKFYDETITPHLRNVGMPEEGVAHLRGHYITRALTNPAALAHLRELYP